MFLAVSNCSGTHIALKGFKKSMALVPVAVFPITPCPLQPEASSPSYSTSVLLVLAAALFAQSCIINPSPGTKTPPRNLDSTDGH
jgi:hypothetical protein